MPFNASFRLLALIAFFSTATSSHAAVNEKIFSGGFESGESAPPPSGAAPSFVNQTQQRLDQILGSEYRFDALWSDFNNDGCYDAFLYDHGNAATSRLWVNRCDGSNTFVYHSGSTVRYTIPNPTYPRGSGWLSLLDFNGDGLQDFWTRDADTMAARYVNATATGAQVPYFSGKQEACNDHCVFGDINGDSQLDIIHPDRSVESMDGDPMRAATGPEAEVIVADVDADGWADILQPELGGYWHNQQGQLQWRNGNLTGSPVHYAVADFDNDGNMDLMTFNEHADNDGEARLYRNVGGHYVDVTAASGLDALSYNSYWTGYGNSVAADINNDGLQDLVVGGATYSPSVTVMRNTGNMHFVKAGVNLGSAGHGSEAYKGRASVADFDNDGRLDIIKTQDLTNVGIWRNTTPTANAPWMKVRVRGSGMNSDGVGADVRWYRHDTSTLVAHMPVRVGPQHPQTWLHTGLGGSTVVDLVVTYPNGGPSYRFDGISSNQEVIVYPNGCLIQHWQPGNGWPLDAPAGCSN